MDTLLAWKPYLLDSVDWKTSAYNRQICPNAGAYGGTQSRNEKVFAI